MNWNDPQSRAALIEAVGPEEYNRRMEQHLKDSTVDTVGDYPIVATQTRFGLLYFVRGTNMAFSTLDQAREYAREITPQ